MTEENFDSSEFSAQMTLQIPSASVAHYYCSRSPSKENLHAAENPPALTADIYVWRSQLDEGVASTRCVDRSWLDLARCRPHSQILRNSGERGSASSESIWWTVKTVDRWREGRREEERKEGKGDRNKIDFSFISKMGGTVVMCQWLSESISSASFLVQVSLSSTVCCPRLTCIPSVMPDSF